MRAILRKKKGNGYTAFDAVAKKASIRVFDGKEGYFTT
jgi:hypothetical protein